MVFITRGRVQVAVTIICMIGMYAAYVTHVEKELSIPVLQESVGIIKQLQVNAVINEQQNQQEGEQKQEETMDINQLLTRSQEGYQREDSRSIPSDGAHGYREPDGLKPCGEICSYVENVVPNSNQIYPLLRKKVNCDNIMQRMSFDNYTIPFPPPEKPPKDMFDEFTMFGKMPIAQNWYIKTEAGLTSGKLGVEFNQTHMQRYIDKIENDQNVNIYINGKCVQDILTNYHHEIREKKTVVIGTQTPWLEAILLAYGAGLVTTLEYREITYKNMPRLQAYTPYEFARKYAAGDTTRYDFAASFSSVEHSGLGRYTDPLNPYGDLEAVAQVWCMVKPGGILALGIPGQLKESVSNFIAWNAHRMYGFQRLQHLTANWKVLEISTCALHHFIILTKLSD